MSRFIISRNNKSLLNETVFYLTKGNMLTLKIDGLNSNTKRHLKFQSNNTLVSIFQRDNYLFREQTLQITALNMGVSVVRAVDTDIDYCPYFAEGVAEDCFPPLTIHVLSKISIPTDLTAEQKAILMVLLAETTSPTSEVVKYNEEEAKKTMQFMHDALLNRVESPKSHELDVPRQGNKLIGLISGPRTIEGFSQYPNIKPSIQDRINGMIASANDGTNSNFLAYRRLIKNAIDIAKSNKVSNTEVIAWRTKGRGSPGQNFIQLFSLQGQNFYKLSDSYLK
ncbi:hypothetical protein [Xenorhabdus bovienii]|uniref:hypothetical protein n=1 Tax=Xenorhabdus bovienii TaxID=40576 RepID=UPI0023B29EC8|nr:hypothetical protein [Xenorhabdus bovienii]MDE9454140.1 hypothetical protein [Xenorhabdus bovienii]MDE9480537.1 hypothetical protein [Xenorhabdus bovienii]MDE9552882.1 hypothetical protein [Xenorhabdus bovienii]MDE9564614.1 hypothetical protein [Xenorhabdus bovienii]